MNVSFHTLGCRLNQSESAILEQSFIDANYKIVDASESADVCVINTCTVTGASDAKCRNSIRGLIRKNPKARVAVIGCYAESGFKAISEIEGVDIIAGNHEKLNLLDYLPESKQEKTILIKEPIPRDNFEINAIGQSTIRCRTSLKVQDGCSFNCTFCIIPSVRGRARSRVFKNLLEEAQLLKERNFKELVLTGVNIGTYHDDKKRLCDVVDEMDRLGIERIRISSIEPTTVDEGLFERMADPRHALVPYLHLPLQSGSDAILEKMGRFYRREEYLSFVQKAKSQVPDICIGTDVLLGFPGETDENFNETLELIRDEAIDYAHAFTYSVRPGTPAAEMKQLHDEVKKNRTLSIRKISQRKWMEFGGRHLGQKVKVLFEEKKGDYYFGHTENFLKVRVKSNSELSDKYAHVFVEKVLSDCVQGKENPPLL